jgi:hypothetical protein
MWAAAAAALLREVTQTRRLMWAAAAAALLREVTQTRRRD